MGVRGSNGGRCLGEWAGDRWRAGRRTHGEVRRRDVIQSHLLRGEGPERLGT